jgi:hypothetical protein
MSLFSKSKRIFVTLFVISFFSLGMQNVSVAAIVSSSDMVAAEQNQLNRDQLKTWMAREDVRDQLVDMGVDVDAAIDRVDSMTDTEVQQLSARMDELPAGSGFVETAVLAFLVLIVLEVTGVTDILPNI